MTPSTYTSHGSDQCDFSKFPKQLRQYLEHSLLLKKVESWVRYYMILPQMISARIEDEQKLVVHHTVEYCNRLEKKKAKQIHVDNNHFLSHHIP